MAVHIDGLAGIAVHIQDDVIRAGEQPSARVRGRIYADAAQVAAAIAAQLRPHSETLGECWAVASAAWGRKAQAERASPARNRCR